MLKFIGSDLILLHLFYFSVSCYLCLPWVCEKMVAQFWKILDESFVLEENADRVVDFMIWMRVNLH